jgi:hypothetical protein
MYVCMYVVCIIYINPTLLAEESLTIATLPTSKSLVRASAVMKMLAPSTIKGLLGTLFSSRNKCQLSGAYIDDDKAWHIINVSSSMLKHKTAYYTLKAHTVHSYRKVKQKC